MRETFLFRREERADREEEEAAGTGDKALATKRSKQNKNRRLKNGRQVSRVFFLLDGQSDGRGETTTVIGVSLYSKLCIY